MQTIRLVTYLSIILIIVGIGLLTETLKHTPQKIGDIRSYPKNFMTLVEKQRIIFFRMLIISVSILLCGLGVAVLLLRKALHSKQPQPCI